MHSKSDNIEIMIIDRGRSCIDSADWIKSTKAAINLVNKKNNKCFQYAVTIALNHEQIKKDLSKNNKK